MEKIIIYQVFTRLFGNRNTSNICNGSIDENGCAKFNDLKYKILTNIVKLGATHVWLTGIIRHATTTSYSKYGIPDSNAAIVKGKAGSPYAITDYYDVDPDLAVDVENRMEEFEKALYLIKKRGLKVIIDFVPNHVARQYHSIMKPKDEKDLGEDDDCNMGFSPNNNFYYCVGEEFNPNFDKGDYKEFPAKATGNNKFDAHPSKNDWYETIKLNYGVDYCDASGVSTHFDPIPNTWIKMRNILFYWIEKGIDGVRCDMAEMVPPEFWAWLTKQTKEKYPNFIFIGEVYNPSLYRKYIESGFDYLYDKVGMYDRMRSIMRGESDTSEITWQWQNTDDINDHMLYFLENHDEQRIASNFFVGNAWKGIPATIVCALMRNNPFMIYAGQEFGEPGMDSEGFSGCDGRTTIFDYWSPKNLNLGMLNRINLPKSDRLLNIKYSSIIGVAQEPSIKEGLFFDLMYANLNNEHFDTHSVYAFIRKSKYQTAIIVANFSDKVQDIEMIIPKHAFEFLKLSEGKHFFRNIFKKSIEIIDLRIDKKLKLSIKPNDGIIMISDSSL